MKGSGLAALLLICAGPAAAQAGFMPALTREPESPVRTQPLAPGEQLLELGGIGYATGLADQVELVVEISISAPAADPALGGRRLDAEIARFRRALMAEGVPAGGIRTAGELPAGTIPDVFDVRPEAPPGRPTYPETVRIQAPFARLAAVRGVFARFQVREIARPVYFLADAAPLRRAALDDALTRIRARADVLAAAAGQRVLRIVRVSERPGLDALNGAVPDIQAFRGDGRPLDPRSRAPGPELEAVAMLGVDFAVAPR